MGGHIDRQIDTQKYRNRERDERDEREREKRERRGGDTGCFSFKSSLLTV